MSMDDLRVSDEDLTAKARIRNAALELFAEQGADRVSMRAVAAAAGVTVGLVQHHFKTKEGLRNAVDQLIVDYHAQAIAQAPDEGSPAHIAAARDRSVRHMFETHPAVVNYVRRAMLDPASDNGRLFARLTDLSRSEIVKARESGLASTHRPESTQVIEIMVRQLGQLFLQPMVDVIWDRLSGPNAPADDKPELTVSIRRPDRVAPGRSDD
ncbi:TetR/AcrR family transcriptional regulator [Rhodococcus sp. ABRD24]|uniref:TetR/AcrR family transcriptional regulator n=1 Tax=Rhodococcus sp. ABRD24 TaxID=2507582 RepID=UPI00103BD655|nr:TetR/AcrR family transcriptional regulator [Rhodococcus sp. ABRD24]QBJ96471.1 TetR/AcrR family transcriptional regulator [Rhodococcus sp. ABRD24]